MSWVAEIVSSHRNKVEEEGEWQCDQLEEKGNGVTSHVYLKPAHSCGSLDKEVVLRRIRQRKRVHKVRAAFQALLTSATSNADKRWIDDAFAAL